MEDNIEVKPLEFSNTDKLYIHDEKWTCEVCGGDAGGDSCGVAISRYTDEVKRDLEGVFGKSDMAVCIICFIKALGVKPIK